MTSDVMVPRDDDDAMCSAASESRLKHKNTRLQTKNIAHTCCSEIRGAKISTNLLPIKTSTCNRMRPLFTQTYCFSAKTAGAPQTGVRYFAFRITPDYMCRYFKFQSQFHATIA